MDEFDFGKLPEYITSSRDKILGDLARREEVEFVSSTSSTTGMLSQVSFSFFLVLVVSVGDSCGG